MNEEGKLSSVEEIPEIETHPFPPFLPPSAKVLIMGTFPPQPKRWSMDFYYPNRSNDFWFMMGLIFFGCKDTFYDRENRQFRLNEIKLFLTEKGIALSDTGYKIRRLQGNASDKFLEIIEPVRLESLLDKTPLCRTLATTGQKAAETLARVTHTEVPGMGEHIFTPADDTSLPARLRDLEIWRMPSTSRAYPAPLENKAKYYSHLFESAGII